MKKKIISGIIVTMFLVTMVTFAIPVQVSAYTADPVYVGIIGPKGWIQWDGIKEGAEIAQDLINDAGGLEDADGTHELRLVEIDEHAVPVPDPTAAVTDLLAALDDNPTMDYLIGGFRTECVLPLREACMDYAAVNERPVWTIAGAATDELIDDGPDDDNPFDDVREDYQRYKYMFRVTPMSSTNLVTQLLYMTAQLMIPKLKGAFGLSLAEGLPTYVIAEDLIWNEAMVAILESDAYQAQLGYKLEGVGRPSAIETDFGPFLDAVEDSGAKLLIHIFSAVAGASFIKQWGERKVTAVPVGINVESQMGEFYSAIGGKCEYETIMASLGTRNNLNPDAEPLSTVEFWDVYVDKYGHTPIYTAWGVYDYLIGFNETFADSYGLTIPQVIEQVIEPTSRDGLMGHFEYTDYHDVYVDSSANTAIWPSWTWLPHEPGVIGWARAHMPQWQDGRLEVVWPRGTWATPGGIGYPGEADPTPLPFAMKWKIPPWVYGLAETDFAGGPEVPMPPVEPVGMFGSLTTPDGTVGPADMGVITGLWQETCWWTVLEADMDANQFIDIDDVARVALDWGKSA